VKRAIWLALVAIVVALTIAAARRYPALDPTTDAAGTAPMAAAR
jgi:hypothetical protein